MKTLRNLLLAAGLVTLVPVKIFACAACYGGNIDSPMANGMNWGILTLLGVVLTVLTCFLVLFVHILRKDEAGAKDSQKPTDV